MVHVERSLGGDEEQCRVLSGTFGLGVQVEQRVLGVVAGVLVELVVVLFLQFALVPGPECGGAVDLLDLVLGSGHIVLVVVCVLVVGKVDRVCDMVAVLLDEVLDLPSVGIFLAFIVHMEHDCGSAALTLGFLDRVLLLAVADPFPGLVRAIGL